MIMRNRQWSRRRSEASAFAGYGKTSWRARGCGMGIDTSPRPNGFASQAPRECFPKRRRSLSREVVPSPPRVRCPVLWNRSAICGPRSRRRGCRMVPRYGRICPLNGWRMATWHGSVGTIWTDMDGYARIWSREYFLAFPSGAFTRWQYLVGKVSRIPAEFHGFSWCCTDSHGFSPRKARIPAILAISRVGGRSSAEANGGEEKIFYHRWAQINTDF
jgi:hypothetical protein